MYIWVSLWHADLYMWVLTHGEVVGSHEFHTMCNRYTNLHPSKQGFCVCTHAWVPVFCLSYIIHSSQWSWHWFHLFLWWLVVLSMFSCMFLFMFVLILCLSWQVSRSTVCFESSYFCNWFFFGVVGGSSLHILCFNSSSDVWLVNDFLPVYHWLLCCLLCYVQAYQFAIILFDCLAVFLVLWWSHCTLSHPW